MNYEQLNKYYRLLQPYLHTDTVFEWEDSEILDIMKGKLPKLKLFSNDNEIQHSYYKINRLCENYDFYSTDRNTIIASIEDEILKISEKQRRQSIIDTSKLDDVISMHKFSLISGEGGIGKSYFITCLEDEVSKLEIKHLFIYGKYCNSINEIDFDEISSIAEKETFIFAFDAVNEIGISEQTELAEKLKSISSITGLRIIITYRSHMLNQSILNMFKSMSPYEYRFPGISFESAIEWLHEEAVDEIDEYIDILYSHNPKLLNMLPKLFKKQKEKNAPLNNICTITHLYENYIKESISRDCWENTKKIAGILYSLNKKYFTDSDINSSITNFSDYISEMEQVGFITEFIDNGIKYYVFDVESLADYVISRSLWDEISGKTPDDIIKIINNKVDAFSDLSREAIILALFDNLVPPENNSENSFFILRRILDKTELIHDLNSDTILKIHFIDSQISLFLKAFRDIFHTDWCLHCAGYLNKPFNCTNYLNHYFENADKQLCVLSTYLAGNHFHDTLKGRLKNMLYYTAKSSCSCERSYENLFTSIWCSAAPNKSIRDLALKLMYDTIHGHEDLIQYVIELFPKISDMYISDAIIHVLSYCNQHQLIDYFFESLLRNPSYTNAKSIRRMSFYIGKGYGYIELEKDNFLNTSDGTVPEDFNHVLFCVDIMDQNLLPFHYNGIDSFNDNVEFFDCDKSHIQKINEKLESHFKCVKTGLCCGNMEFPKTAEKLLGMSFHEKLVDGTKILTALNHTLDKILTQFGLSSKILYNSKYDGYEFQSSVFRKCIDIAVDILWGSLMCNYYTKEFATYNSRQDVIGYEVFDPLEFDESLNLYSPISVYQPVIEKMSAKVLEKIEVPNNKDENWWNDLELTRKNLLSILSPIRHKKSEWQLLSCTISLKKSGWQDNYNIFVCCSSNETLSGDGMERYLTIETDKYIGALMDYPNTTQKSWLCKSIPTVSHESTMLDYTRLMLPPADIVRYLSLVLDETKMTWNNCGGEAIIICNNNKSSYYDDPIIETIFIRKDAYEELTKNMCIKYFAYAERYLDGIGFSSETEYHFEIANNIIIKEISNRSPIHKNATHAQCQDCKHGINYEEKSKSQEADLQKYIDLIVKNGYSNADK